MGAFFLSNLFVGIDGETDPLLLLVLRSLFRGGVGDCCMTVFVTLGHGGEGDCGKIGLFRIKFPFFICMCDSLKQIHLCHVIRLSGVNFTITLSPAFSYKSVFLSFFVLTVKVCYFLSKGNQRKSSS